MLSCRGLLGVLLILALVLGTAQFMPASAEMQSNVQSSAMKAMTSDPSVSGMCDKCLKKAAATHSCFGVCVGVQAVLPVASVFRVFARAPLEFRVERQFNGATAPPDLPPPKLSDLV